MKCKVFEESGFYDLQDKINDFLAEGHEISHISHSTYNYGYNCYYTAVILYRY